MEEEVQDEVRKGSEGYTYTKGYIGPRVFCHLDSAVQGRSNILLLSTEASQTERVRLFLALPRSSENFLKSMSLYFQLIFGSSRVGTNVSLQSGRMRSEI